MSPSPTRSSIGMRTTPRADRTTRFASRMPRLAVSCLKGRRPPAGAPTPCEGRPRSVWVVSRNSGGANAPWGRWMESDSPDGAKPIHLRARGKWAEVAYPELLSWGDNNCRQTGHSGGPTFGPHMRFESWTDGMCRLFFSREIPGSMKSLATHHEGSNFMSPQRQPGIYPSSSRHNAQQMERLPVTLAS